MGGLFSKLEQLSVRLDGMILTGRTLQDQSRTLASRLEPLRGSVVICPSNHPDRVLVSLAAAEMSGCEALLSRSPSSSLGDRASAWGAAATIDDDLCVRVLRVPETRGRSFNVLIGTSGTTGTPKLARHSLQALLGRIRSHPGPERPSWLLTYHPATFGGLQVLLTALETGANLVSLSQPSAATLAAEALAAHPTHVSGTPTFWRAFVIALGTQARLVPLKQITLGGEIVDQAILDRLRAIWPDAGLTHIYASTEAGALFAVRDGRAGFPAEWFEAGVEGVSLRVRDGVLETLSPRAMLAYHDTTTPVPVARDGWLVTGDLVEVTHGRVHFRGRVDSLLSVGGAKVRPEEVEEALLSLPRVAEARVYGIPNPLTGCILGAEVIVSGGDEPEAFRAWILSELRKRLEPHKVPRVVKVVSSLPTSTGGKKERSR